MNRFDLVRDAEGTLWIQSMEARRRFTLTIDLKHAEDHGSVTFEKLEPARAHELGEVITGEVTFRVDESGKIFAHNASTEGTNVDFRFGERREKRILLIIPPNETEIGVMQIT